MMKLALLPLPLVALGLGSVMGCSASDPPTSPAGSSSSVPADNRDPHPSTSPAPGSTPTAPGVTVSPTATAPDCTEANKTDVWTQRFALPVKPPRYAAGIDLRGGDTGAGVTLESMQKALCVGTDATTPDDDTQVIEWGNALTAQFDKTTHRLTYVELGTDYKGAVEFSSRPGSSFGAHTYSIRPGAPLERDQQPFAFDWEDSTKTATELTDALAFTFAPDQPAGQTDCKAAKTCLVMAGDADTGAVFGARPARFYLHMTSTDQASASTPDFTYMFPVPNTQ